MNILLIQKVLFVSSEDDTVLVAMDLTSEDEYISWFDTVKERRMQCAEVLENTPEKFVFKRKDGKGETYTFEPMTLELYYSKVKPKLIAGEDFETQEALYEAFMRTISSAW